MEEIMDKEKIEANAWEFVEDYYREMHQLSSSHLLLVAKYIYFKSAGRRDENNQIWCDYEELPRALGTLLSALHIDVLDIIADLAEEVHDEEEEELNEYLALQRDKRDVQKSIDEK